MRILKQSSTAQPLVFLLIDSTDHITGKTGLTPTVTISKNGGSFASPSGSVSEIANGWYKVAGNATDTGTLGPLILHATATGADPSDIEYEVVTIDVQASGGKLPATIAAGDLADIPTVRAAKLDNLDAAVSTRSSLDAIGVWSYTTRILTAGSNIVLPSNGLANVTAWTVAIVGNITGNLSGSVGSVTGNIGGNVVGNVQGSVTVDASAVAADVVARLERRLEAVEAVVRTRAKPGDAMSFMGRTA